MMRPRILLADDHVLVLEAFRKLLAADYDIVGAVTDGQSLVQAVDDLRPDVILLDVSMPRLNGLDAIERIKVIRPHARIIVLTMQEDRDTAADAIRRGALGFVLKSSPPSELFEAIGSVLRGTVFVSPTVADVPAAVFAREAVRPARRSGLTLRQREVLQLLAEGKSMAEAARVLNVTPRTIAFHKYSMMEQLGFKTTSELILHAAALGLVARDRGAS
jgi:DNA-binding NarL/FixJ family response regulator